MKIKKLVKSIYIITLILILMVILISLLLFMKNDFDEKRLAYLHVIVDIFKSILISFFAGTVIILVPYIFQERKYDFELNKEARIAYSEAYTGSLYVNNTIAYCKTPEDAYKYLESLHIKKHLAETYFKNLEQKNPGEPLIQRRIWPPGSEPGMILGEVKSKVEKISINWNSMTENERFSYLIQS